MAGAQMQGGNQCYEPIIYASYVRLVGCRQCLLLAHHSRMLVLQGGAHTNAASTAAAAGVASAASNLSLTDNTAGKQQQQLPAVKEAPKLADKERLAAQIAVKEKVLKLLRKQKTSADPATRARLQHKLDKILGRTSPALAAAGNGASAASAHGAAGSSGLSHGAQKPKLQQRQQQRQPLAGMAPVLAVTSAELVSLSAPCALVIHLFISSQQRWQYWQLVLCVAAWACAAWVPSRWQAVG
jgi:hypothetical protein